MKKSMEAYILEAKEVGLRNLNNRREITEALVNYYQKNNCREVLIIASGSSGNAAACARLFMQEVLHCPVTVRSPFTFEHYENDINTNTLVMVISQSGYSTNSIAALEKLKSMHHYTIGVTGDLNSDLKNYCDLLIDYQVGIETVGYVTKGVVTLCEFLMLFSLEAALQTKKISEEEFQFYVAEIAQAFICHEETYRAVRAFYTDNEKALLSMNCVYICGSGPGLGVALEGALKIGETVKIPAVAYEIEEYIHGPNLQLTPNYTVFFIDNNDATSLRTQQIFDASAAITDSCFLISNRRKGNKVISTEHAACALVAPLYQLVVFQYLAYQITEKLNHWATHPLFKEFENIVDCKSENYKNSPLASQD